jgi:hypothetical protein
LTKNSFGKYCIDKVHRKEETKNFYTIVCQNRLCTNRKKSHPNHFIGAASYNKVKASINNLLFALEIHLCNFKLLLAEFKKLNCFSALLWIYKLFFYENYFMVYLKV